MATINTGDDVDNALIVNRFNELLRDRINPTIQVSNATPFSTGTYRELTNTDPTTTGGIPISNIGAAVVSPAVESSLTGIVDASELASYLRELTRDYTMVRKIHWRLRLNTTGFPSGNGLIVQEEVPVAVMHFNYPIYKQTVTDQAATYNIETTDTIDASDFELFMADLYSQWNTLKENSIDVFVDTCHASCHSNCHGSRGRR